MERLGTKGRGYRELQCSKQSSWDLQGVHLLEPEGSLALPFQSDLTNR